MGKHKKHHKKRSSHGHSAPAFPTPAFYTPHTPQLPLHLGPPPSVSSPPSLCVSIDLESLQQQQQQQQQQQEDWSETQQQPQQKHKTHHHHHHHRKSHHKHSRTEGSGGGSNSNPVFESAELGVGGGSGVERPAIPPLRISLHSSSSSLSSSISSSALSSSSSSSSELVGVGGKGDVKELKVSLPISRLHGGKEEGEDGGRKERERYHKKHKKHKEKKRHDQETFGGLKTTSRVEFGAKLCPTGGGEGASHGERGEEERKSYGGKGLGKRATLELGAGSGRGSLQSQRGDRPQLGQKEHPLSLSYTSHHPPPSHPPSSHTSTSHHPPPSHPPSSHTSTSHHPPPSHPHSSHTSTSHHVPPSSHTSISHHPPPSHPASSHTSTSHHVPPSSSPLLGTKFSDKYHQHKKRMIEDDESDYRPAPSLPHSSQSSSSVETTPSLPHLLPTSHTAPLETHKHHKKKKKKKYSKSHLADATSIDLGHSATVKQRQSEEKLPTPPISEVSTSSLERELVDLRPFSPPLVSPTPVHVEKERGTEEKGREEGRGWLAAKKIKISAVTDTALTSAPLSLASVSAPKTTPTSSLLGKSGRSMTDEATPPKRHRSSMGGRAGVGKQLWMVETRGGGDSEEEEEEEGEEEGEFGGVLADYDPPPMAHLQAPSPQPSHPTVLLSRASLKMFLANILRLVQKYDPEVIFAEPVTDEIAPGYSALIKHPMDLSTMATKLSNHAYSSVDEFRSDFVLMCKNAMTYNAPETVYFSFAKSMMEDGIKIIEREVSLRPDIRYGRVATPSNSQTPVPIPLSSRGPSPAPSLNSVDYSSPYVCRINLSLLAPLPPVIQPQVVGMATSPASSLEVLEEVGVASEQSHLTQVVVGVPPEDREEGEEGAVPVSLVTEEDPDEILRQVHKAAEEVKENLDGNQPNTKFCFIRDASPSPSPQPQPVGADGVAAGRKKATMNILNPDSGLVDSSKPLNLTALSERVRGGNNAATVLRTELPMFKATPVSYLMNGPFGSFAPTYDSAFATLTKMDSDLLLHTYGSDLGVSYSHSLLQFVKGAGSFASEMADAVLNSLTAGRHEKFMEQYHTWEETERLGRTKKEEGNKKEEKEGEGEREDTKEEEEKGEGEKRGENKEGEEDEKQTDSGNDGRGEECDEGGRGEEREVSGKEGEDEEDTRQEASETVGEDQEECVEEAEEREDWFDGGGVEEGEEEGGEGREEGGETETHSLSLSPDSSNGSTSSTDRDLSEEGEEEESPGESKSEMSPSLSPSQEEQEREQRSQPTVSEGLSEGARLISGLQSYQWQRLSEPPSLDKSRHTVLPPPSQQERDTATKLVTQLAVLTAQTRPGDLVQVSSLRGAMGLPAENEAPSLSSPQDPTSPPSQSTTDTDQQPTNST